MEISTRLIGSHHALDQVAQPDRFQSWVDHNLETDDTYAEGYKILVRTFFRTFQSQLNLHKDLLRIESSFEYFRADSSIADIDSLSTDCEASHLLKHLNEFDRRLYRAHNHEFLENEIQSLRDEVIEPFEKLFKKFGRTNTPLELSNYLALHALETTFSAANDATGGYPEAFQLSWLDRRFSQTELDDGFEGYTVALAWLYTELAMEGTDISRVQEMLLDADSWQEVNRSYQQIRELLLEPVEGHTGSSSANYDLDVPEGATEIDHLLEGAPDAAVGIEKALDRIFLWEMALPGNEVFPGSGSAGLILVLEGLQSIRSRRDTDEPIQVRRLKHPDEPGYNYSYAVEHSGWTIERTGSLHGWAVFVRIATDYSGFGGRQHDFVEELLSDLSDKGIIDIKELEVQEDTLRAYLDEQQASQLGHTQSETTDYDNRQLPRIIADGEGTRTEFKEEFLDSMIENGKEIAALANYKGGVLVYGVSDRGKVVGVENQEEVENKISGILRDSMAPPLSADIHPITYEDKSLVVVDIPEADQPIAYDYIYYFRNGTNVRKLTYPELKKRFG